MFKLIQTPLLFCHYDMLLNAILAVFVALSERSLDTDWCET